MGERKRKACRTFLKPCCHLSGVDRFHSRIRQFPGTDSHISKELDEYNETVCPPASATSQADADTPSVPMGAFRTVFHVALALFEIPCVPQIPAMNSRCRYEDSPFRQPRLPSASLPSADAKCRRSKQRRYVSTVSFFLTFEVGKKRIHAFPAHCNRFLCRLRCLFLNQVSAPYSPPFCGMCNRTRVLLYT